MYTAIVVYHAPQMKNWRNIIVDSLVRITASSCRDRARSHLGGITRRDSASSVDRLERVDRRFDRVRGAAYSDARNAQRQGPRRAGIGRRFDVSDLAIDDRAGGDDDPPGRILH